MGFVGSGQLFGAIIRGNGFVRCVFRRLGRRATRAGWPGIEAEADETPCQGDDRSALKWVQRNHSAIPGVAVPYSYIGQAQSLP
jgi:hypothetical protein